MTKHLEKVNHDYIRYANCWEDADLLLSGLSIEKEDTVLSIGSAGDNSFSLLSQGPQLVVAIDINNAQLNLIALKKAAFQSLSYDAFLKFLGFRASEDRGQYYRRVRNCLSTSLQQYWDSNLDLIENGIIYQGKFEKYFQLFRTRILPMVHNTTTIDQLFTRKDESAQKIFYDRKWNNLRWRTFFNIFFSKKVMGWLGRDPQFLSEVNITVSQFIQYQAQNHLQSTDCQTNPFLHFILKGEFGTLLPHYARRENFDKIVANIDKMVIMPGYAEDAIVQHGKFTKFNLSNIFEYMDIATFSKISQTLIQGSIADAKFAYWNLMVPREMSKVTTNVRLIQMRNKQDNGFFYSSFNVNRRA